ncbi:MAG: BACON domain-containing protein [Tannerellaceae bacterium]|jgi:hypothetical protein|nr:BACON domain-containing protein [Tannerellaceae bacterium]
MNKYYKAVIYLLSLITLLSCAGEELFHETELTPPSANNNLKQLSLTLYIPGTNAPATFSYSTIDENDIKTVDILVFRTGPYGEYYYKHISVGDIRNNQSSTSKIFDIAMEAINARLILLANVSHLFSDEINDRLENDSKIGNVTKQTILDYFVFDYTHPWTGDNNEHDYSFPMYGESAIIPANSTVVSEIKMIRSIARIDVAGSSNVNNWRIDSVYIFNTKNKGYVAPAFGPNGNIAETPRIPVDAALNTQGFGFKFRPNAGVSTPLMEREIYIPEDPQTRGKVPTCIVLKIDKPAQKSKYYCAEIQDDNGDFLPLLRNYRYRILITGISGEGYDSPEEAAIMPASFINAEVETEELGLGHIVFNSEHKLGVSVQHIHFDANGSSGNMGMDKKAFSLKVFTTYPKWSVSADASLSEWLNVEGGDELHVERAASLRTLELIAAPNYSEQARYGRIYIKSGTLQQEITISQDGRPKQ